MLSCLPAKFKIVRDVNRCIKCKVCVQQCAYEVHNYDAEEDEIFSEEKSCVSCHRCVNMCPTQALTVVVYQLDYVPNANWKKLDIMRLTEQAESGGVLLTGMGNDLAYPIIWDNIVLNASQVTNPSIDPLREPMELRTYFGRKTNTVEIEMGANGIPRLKTKLGLIKLEVPIIFSAMSFGSISYNVHRALAESAKDLGILYNTGEGGLHKDFYQYGSNTIVQCASGRFGIDEYYLQQGVAIEIKIGQGAKPGIGGHLPGEKVDERISMTRMIPTGTDAISPAPHHDIYSIEDLRQLIFSIKEATYYKMPVGVKIAAVHNVAAISSGIARAGADFITIDGFRGGTGAAPTMIRDNVGIPIEFAIASVDDRLRQEGIRNEITLVASGGFRNSADIVKAIALGADVIAIGTPALIACGCHVCQNCYSGKCNWGIATQDPQLTKRVNPDIATRRLKNLIRAWSLEIKEFLGAMGVNAIESLRGNREHLRGIGLSKNYLDILGIKEVGR